MSGFTSGECEDETEIHEESDDDAMTWTEPQYSRKAVGRAGEALENLNSEEYAQALVVVNNWRASHACPLNSLQSSLRYRARGIASDILISQRLKRVPSIKGKLRRSKGMQLHRMQDIGGCRAILPTVKEVYSLRDKMIQKPLRSSLAKEFDYIKAPKPSGYRGIHLIYKFQGKKYSAHDGLLIEVQLRSVIQHAWATSVEIAGAFLGDSLKSGEGSSEWLRFFNLVSTLFAALEDGGLENSEESATPAAKQEATDLENRLSIIDKLQAFSVVTEYSSSIDAPGGYFLLTLKIDEKRVSINYYPTKDLDSATEAYLGLEEEYKNSDVNIVLVAAESIWSLKKSYPNYFADSQIFVDTLARVLGT